jgi:dolichol-phosphate mannosyltransferase
MKASVILPTYNESGNIVDLVRAITAVMPKEYDYEIIVVDDNSPDKTHQLVRDAFAGDPHVIPILRTADRGLAKSIRAGLERSSGDYAIVMDTDFTHNPREIPRMLHLNRVANVVVGSRFAPGGSMEDVPHYLCSLAYNWFLRMFLRTQIQDNLSGFLALDRSALSKLPADAIFFGYGDYCFRLLHYAQRAGLSVLEMPVQYQTRTKGQSKSVFWKLLFSYTRALVEVRTAIRKQRNKPLPTGLQRTGSLAVQASRVQPAVERE